MKDIFESYTDKNESLNFGTEYVLSDDLESMSNCVIDDILSGKQTSDKKKRRHFRYTINKNICLSALSF
jgi:hypothetical protein